MEPAVTGVLRELGLLPFPAMALHHRTACLFQQHKESAAISFGHQGARGLSSSPSDLSGGLRNLENLMLPFVMLLALPEKEKPSDLFLYLCLAPCRLSPWAVGSCCPPLGIV